MNTSFARRLRTLTITTGVAMSMIIGAGAASDVVAQDTDEDCQADRSNHLLGGLLTDELTFLSDLLPFTVAGEQYPVCE